MKTSRSDLEFKINSTVGLTIFSMIFFIASFVYIAACYRFDYWYLLSILIIAQIILGSLYIISLKKISVYSNKVDESLMHRVLLLTLLHLLVLNFFVVIVGMYVYKKLTSPLNNIF